MNGVPRAVNGLASSYRVAVAAWLLGWFWKGAFFSSYLLGETFAVPLRVSFLPSWLTHPAVSAVAWLAPVVVLPTLGFVRPWSIRGGAAVLVLSSLLACIHLETFNDATFVTSFWAALWILWLTMQRPALDADVAHHARRLAQGVIGVVFLGGAIGKITPEYISGDAFLHLYFERARFPFDWLHAHLSEGGLRLAAAGFARTAIVAELALATIPFWPYRPARNLALVVMVGMILVSTFYLTSVMASLAGILFAAGVVKPSNNGAAQRST